MPQDQSDTPAVIQWVIDTRKLWLAATKTAELASVVSRVQSSSLLRENIEG